MTKAIASDTRTQTITRTVQLDGLTPIMFDRYAGDNSTKLLWHQKVYLRRGTDELCLPAMNIVSLLSSLNTNSAPKRLRDSRRYTKIANACLSYVVIQAEDGGDEIPFLRDGQPIKVGTPGDERDETSGLLLHRATARLAKGIPNPKERPMLLAPWSLRIKVTIVKNNEITEVDVRNLIDEAGIAIGLGTFRGVFGKYRTTWEE